MLKRLLFTTVILSVLIGMFHPKLYAQTNTQQPTKIYRTSTSHFQKELVAELPPFHFARMSPSTSFLYLERIGATKKDPTTSYLYEMKTKKLVKLNGLGKWYPKSDKLVLLEGGNLVRFDPVSGKKDTLVTGSKDGPILDFAVSPDENYMAFFTNSHIDNRSEQLLYLQHLPTLKMKVNDRFQSEYQKNRFSPSFQWMPNSKKLFYKAGETVKELDMPTGLKYVHKLMKMPSYSADLKYGLETNQSGNVLKKLDDGKTLLVGQYSGSISQGLLDDEVWAPFGHSFVANEFLYTSNAQDSYVRFRYQDGEKGQYFPKDSYGEPSLFLHDNIRFIGWSQDAKWMYTADLNSIHCFSYEDRCTPESNNLLVIEP
ncbi:hypothetical protein EDM52_18960 [Brevibacillus invocatus]|uniref:Uncharacterized protein n=1 Tax=Brevibacillus invocatus TaxID=173959 RepID=A0A3M8C236_9BACL|nr:hypothetical protein [Brevibacillus invocatus]RNB69553.1 hypothetical protein EDM52_18960 [Brevibacillus invocatus]